MKQAIDYAQILDIPFAYSTNGEGFIEHDFFTGKEKELKLEEFPKEDELWDRYLKGKNLNTKQEEIITEPNHFDTFTKKKPRYYQRIAIDRTVEAIAKGQKRILLVMATGERVIIVTGCSLCYKIKGFRSFKQIYFVHCLE